MYGGLYGDTPAAGAHRLPIVSFLIKPRPTAPAMATDPVGEDMDNSTATAANPLVKDTQHARVLDLEQQQQQVATREVEAGQTHQSTGVAAQLARIGTAPTNWHQATIFFLTSKAEQDAVMRKRAPYMYLAGLMMVVLQIGAAYGILLGMLHPACLNNSQCEQAGFYCHTAGSIGRCIACGEEAPLVPYFSDKLVPSTNSAGQKLSINSKEKSSRYQEMNLVKDMSYPYLEWGIGKRSDSPDAFAGYNFTMVKDRCTEPVDSFQWSVQSSSTLTMVDRGDLPPEFEVFMLPKITRGSSPVVVSYSKKAVTNWCSVCTRIIHPGEFRPDPLSDNGMELFDNVTALSVSVMNKKLQAVLSVNAMTLPDWLALLLCSFVVGLTVVGEIKDTALCAMSAERNIEELSKFWQVALWSLETLRSQFFLQPLMGAIPVVVLTEGGSAMSICFNTIAILFITEVDNMCVASHESVVATAHLDCLRRSYHIGLGERAKERVDTHGHVVLTNEEALMLARTKGLCTLRDADCTG
eukprot:SAG31_NODE_2997_length_4803_cov_4.274872_1_plen_524_part_00